MGATRYSGKLNLYLTDALVARMERVRALRGAFLGVAPVAADVYREALAVGLRELERDETRRADPVTALPLPALPLLDPVRPAPKEGPRVDAAPAPVDADPNLPRDAPGTDAPRHAAPVEPEADRRGPLRLTDGDAGAWVKALGAGNKSAHRLARIGGGGVAEFTCGATEGLRNLVLAAEVGGKRRCARCEAAP